jgi:hypothetical protein
MSSAWQLRGRLSVEHRGTHRHDDGVGKHHDARQLEAMQAARGVQDHVRDAAGQAQHVLVHGPGRDGGQRGIAALQPGPAGLLAIHVAQHDRKALPRAPRRHMGGESAFAASALAVDDCDHGHGSISG